MAMQRKLELQERSRHGGKRAGAGRKPAGTRAGVSHLRRESFASRHALHVTLRCAPHVYSLRSRRCFRVIAAAFTAGRERFGARLIHYSVQGNHLHLVMEARDRAALARAVKGLCVRIARGLNRLMGTKGRVFADRYHVHVLRTPREVRNALAYVLGNFGVHAARLGKRVAVLLPRDSFASARLAGGELRVEATGTTVPARTWLLSMGWRRAREPTHATAYVS